jgi:membrane-bound lytic murein transglycosylase F
MRRIFSYCVVPLLFATVGALLSLFAVDIVNYSEKRLKLRETEAEKWILSPFDNMFKDVGAQCDVDWVLLSAIASAESEFNPNAISSAGAVGIMQVMPAVAKNLGYERDSLFNPRICAEVAAILLHENNDMLSLSQSIDKTERLIFILACYNAGYSRISDARRLARYHEEDGNKWSVVEEYLTLLAEPEFAEHEVVRSGAFHGSAETRAYVKRVMRRYNRFKFKIQVHSDDHH